MKGLTAAFLVWTLLSLEGGSSQAWPTHTACKDGGLEVLYQSCDPLQDFGFSVDQCSRHLKSNLSIRFGMILREDIKELFLDVSLFSEGLSILSYSYPICEEDLPKFSFCGRKRGEQIYYAGPVNNPGFDIPKELQALQPEPTVQDEPVNCKRSLKELVGCANADFIPSTRCPRLHTCNEVPESTCF
ncbi:lymphocyte antigen 86 [Phyllostomus discolor]|uniref:Lymphocyte antigen 86 n=1 Tax=Phyllostomus discolor TaxID=89673 RepID=A0A834E6T9_9CHIR|nr:lymphocyte antigen 86 [Phyllostomus discolor]